MRSSPAFFEKKRYKVSILIVEYKRRKKCFNNAAFFLDAKKIAITVEFM
jgi:hypothetical protein